MRAKYSPRPLPLSCGVCGAGAADVQHYGSVACYSCRAFFRRCVGEEKNYSVCARGKGECLVDRVTRTNCKKCRLAKCFKIGMKKDKVAHRKNKKRKQNIKVSEISVSQFFKEPSRTDSEKSECVDICELAEECILQELKDNFSPEKDQYLRNIIYEMLPSPKLTIEEEYRICEFEAVKEYLLLNIWKSLERQIPNLKDHISLFLYAITMGIPIDFQKQLNFMQRKRECIRNDLINGGCVKSVLNSVEIFKNVPESAKVETFRCSLEAAGMCIRAFMKINDDKVFLVEQRKAAGLSRFALYDDDVVGGAVFDKRAVPCINVLSPFRSPWARKKEDEEYLSRTLSRLGEIVRDDVKLGTVYLTLVLATPPSEATEETKSNPWLLAVQQEVGLLLYRYLSNKYPDTEEAQQLYSDLRGLISDLAACSRINVFGRLESPGPPELLLLDINQ